MTFAPGFDCSITNLSLFGASGSRVTLRSAAPGSQWRLNVASWQVVGHVDVEDSDASGGITIVPILSSNSGNNVNWDFGNTDKWQAWDGSSGNNFLVADNWTPSGVPGEDSWLLIDGNHAAAPVISGVSTVGQLVVGGYETATFTVNEALTVTGDVRVLTSGTLTHSANSSTPVYSLDLTVGGGLLVNGRIDVNGKGYAADQGPGKGLPAQGGAGHGGEGGYWPSAGTGPQNAGSCYGSVTSPITLGSGGDNGAGGGAIRLRVTGNTQLGGTISADGPDLGSTGGGAGGSIWLTTGTLAGDGLIRADGSRSGTYLGYGYGHGGGGRIAVYLDTGNNIDGVLLQAASKRGANSAHKGGGAGTVYLKKASDVHGACFIDNNSVINARRTLVTSNVTDAVVGDLVLLNTAQLHIMTNQSLTVNGSWSNAATFTCDVGSTVTLAGAGEAVVLNDNAFRSLALTGTGTHKFEAGKTTTVDTFLHIMGPTLRSTVDDTAWYLSLDVGGGQSVSRVSVRDSDASGGQTIVADWPNENLGNNVNWEFIRPAGTMFIVR